MENGKEFFAAIRTGDAATLKAMLDADPSLVNAKNEQGQSPVLAAVYSGRSEIRDALIARGAHLEFHEAAAAGQLERRATFEELRVYIARRMRPLR